MEIIESSDSKKSNFLIEIIDKLVDYFDKNNKCLRLKAELENLRKNFKACDKKVTEIESFASEYDIDKDTPANGYRSFVDIFNSATKHISNICNKIHKEHQSFLFRADNFTDEITEWSFIVETLSKICSALIATHQNSETGCLFSDSDSYDNELTRTLREIDQNCFYGKNIGFQFCPSMRPILKFIVVSMACYYSFYFKSKPKVFKVLRFPVSFMKHHSIAKKRSAKVIKAYDGSTTKFCKSFWFLNEGKIVHPLASFIAPNVKINRIFNIHPKDLQVFSEILNKLIDVPPPQSHFGVAPIQCRLVSARKRKGMLKLKENSKGPRLSKNLIFHVHGGGFAAQTSKSHESYLRKWAVDLDVPILSIDYSLTPEAPFPRALEEIFYAYCWALKNPEILGSTGENIVFVGDSAGGNLVTACTIKCIEMGVRKPKGVLNIYAALSLNFKDSPSRFLSLIDPILPFGFISRLIKEYAAVKDENDNNLAAKNEKKNKQGKQRNQFKSNEEEFDVKVNENHLISPYNAPDEVLAKFPPTKFVTSNFDPCLDDCVEFAKKMKKFGVESSLDLVRDLPHGFLYFSQASKECNDAVILCADKIQSFF